MTYEFMNNSWANELEHAGAEFSWTCVELTGKPRAQGELRTG